MGNALRHVRGESQKNIVRFIEGLSGKYSRWDIWQDFIIMSAIAIANTMGGPQAKAREEMYRSRAEKYSAKELEVFADMLLEVVAELERDPEQDFLGELFMALGLGNEWKGQFFTPYSVCRVMSAMTYAPDMTARIEKQGWVSVNDPACGAGALLLAFANECRRQHINYQTSVLFVAQDIDFLAGCMCYMPDEIVKMGMMFEDSKRYSGRLELKLNAATKRMPKWVSVKERLPEDRSNVLVVAYWHERWGVYMGWCAPERAKWSVHVGIGDRSDVAVVYWMPLPAPPKEDDRND